MEQRVSLITLGVSDLARSRAFYEGLGWTTGAAPDDDVVFFQAGGMIVALWDRKRLAEDSGVEDAGGSAGFFGGWAELLPPTVELLAVRYPGREDRSNEPPATDMDGLAALRLLMEKFPKPKPLGML